MSKIIRLFLCGGLIACAVFARAMPVAAAEMGAPNARLQQALAGLADSARPGVLGVTVLDLDQGTRTRINAERAYPMMSVFKAPVAAVVLASS